jgi:hypothetical protein
VTPRFGALFACIVCRQLARYCREGNDRSTLSQTTDLTHCRGISSRYTPLPIKRRVGLQRQLQAGFVMMRSLVVLLLFLQTAAAAALSPMQAREAQREFAGADTNGDGFLERDEIMALDEVRTQPTAAEVQPRVRPVTRARARESGSGSGLRKPKQHTSRVPVVCQCVATSRGARRRWRATGEQAAPRDRSARRSNLVGLGSGSAPGSGLEPRLEPSSPSNPNSHR